jgi:putative transcriptional regulator
MKDTDFKSLLKSIKQADLIKKGKLKPGRVFSYSMPDVKAIRENLHISQIEFAHMIGVSENTIQNWEQGRRKPEGPAVALLKVTQSNPRAVLEALHTPVDLR